jgi:hypothetical protein
VFRYLITIALMLAISSTAPVAVADAESAWTR